MSAQAEHDHIEVGAATDDGVPLVACEDCGILTREDVLVDVSELNAWPIAIACPACASAIFADDDDPAAGDRWNDEDDVGAGLAIVVRRDLLVEAEWVDEHVGLPGDVIVDAGFAFHGGERAISDVIGAHVTVHYLVESKERAAAEVGARAFAMELMGRGALCVTFVGEVVDSPAHESVVARRPANDEVVRLTGGC